MESFIAPRFSKNSRYNLNPEYNKLSCFYLVNDSFKNHLIYINISICNAKLCRSLAKFMNTSRFIQPMLYSLCNFFHSLT